MGTGAVRGVRGGIVRGGGDRVGAVFSSIRSKLLENKCVRDSTNRLRMSREGMMGEGRGGILKLLFSSVICHK